MTQLLQLSISGLALGASYALIALGFSVVYRASRLFNFAHGELLSLGAFLMTALVEVMPWWLALAASACLTGGLAALLERTVLRRMVGRPVFTTIILTLFLGLLLRAGIVIAFGTDTRGMPTPWDAMAEVQVGNSSVLLSSLISLGATTVVLVGMHALVQRTPMGVAMRAASENQEVALVLGIPVGRVLAFTWFLAGATAAVAGIFLGMFPRSVDSNLGYVALRAFPAIIVGGLESVVGAVVAAFMLGLLEVLSQAYVNPHLGAFGHNFHAVFPYAAMILFLVLRPRGLWGEHEVRRV
ncbi:branched-chain amino acid ABC transporter permease [Myxococcus sp. CA056]|uniref:branched-chain amino acid ABC transporter permease n=1 Tax=unclassified Myxococcus TaxID=2648731 RepID=UPI00157B0B2C|nr:MULTISPECIES: branched-chain amino acid ABC transporter permease [unclassified Myxococcus]NTX10072.1 branched-chain amino acid ABC transporter permease [Myxococcus sp. CA056]NTX53024.1 branched-chain amino acid ABC transporter permease [Myxococcus sp. CA039A]